ncbi:MAG: hypothetical protein ACLUW6_03070 [Coriobacteriaceae bacterium]
MAPFFLNDPRTGDAADAFAALAELDVEAAAAEWPFVDAVEAAADLALMREGLSPEPITRAGVGVPSPVRGARASARAAVGVGVHRPRMRHLRRGHARPARA